MSSENRADSGDNVVSVACGDATPHSVPVARNFRRAIADPSSSRTACPLANPIEQTSTGAVVAIDCVTPDARKDALL